EEFGQTLSTDPRGFSSSLQQETATYATTYDKQALNRTENPLVNTEATPDIDSRPQRPIHSLAAKPTHSCP
ncbi:MAG: hypothetical protein MJA28_15870, partial [Gammaproteobacteria bacterium]|nr:hypothetical protein [Gammaproteobacteria bacterium]